MLFFIPTLFWRVHETIIGTRFNIYVWLVISSKHNGIAASFCCKHLWCYHQKYVTFDIWKWKQQDQKKKKTSQVPWWQLELVSGGASKRETKLNHQVVQLWPKIVLNLMLSIELPWFSLQLDFLQHLVFLYVIIIKIDTKHYVYTAPCCIAWQWALNPLNKQNYTQHAHTWRLLNSWFIETRKYFPTLAGLLPQSSSCQDHPGHCVYVIYTIVIFWFKKKPLLVIPSRSEPSLGALLFCPLKRGVAETEE